MAKTKATRWIQPGYSIPTLKVDREKEDLLKRYLLPGKMVDVGCGNGLYGLLAASRGLDVLQLDISDHRDTYARHLPFVAMDVQLLDLQDDSFDNVVAFDIIEHLDDDKLFLREVRRVLRTDGRLIMSVPNPADEQLRRLSLTHIHYTDKTHRREYERESLAALLTELGFKIITLKAHFNSALPYFACALAKNGFFPKVAGRLISTQVRLFERLGFFENRTVADWFCVAENDKLYYRPITTTNVHT